MNNSLKRWLSKVASRNMENCGVTSAISWKRIGEGRKMKIVVCADGVVGLEIVRWLTINHPSKIELYIVKAENEIFSHCKRARLPVFALNGNNLEDVLSRHLGTFDLGILVWWPTLISQSTIALAKIGFVNTHPSLLPLNRGKHPNFWAMSQGEPFGVSLHFLGPGIDDGDLVAQRQVHYDWTDDGGSLYRRALVEMTALFVDTFPQLIEEKCVRQKQSDKDSTLHYANELDKASCIELEKTYTGRELLNLLRARTFDNHPSCWFVDKDEAFEVRVKISKKEI